MSWKNILDVESWNLIRNDVEDPHVNQHKAILLKADAVDPVRIRETNGSGTGTVQGKKIPESVSVTWFILKDASGKETPRAQALKFKKAEYTEANAKAWLKDNSIKYESFDVAKKGDRNNSYFEIINQDDGDTADIFLFGHIGELDFLGDVSAQAFKDEFMAVTANKINLHIHSPGGNVAEGFAIFNLLKFSKKEINVFVDGIAFSIAGFIMLAAKTINLPRNTLVMFHNASTPFGGNATELAEKIKLLGQIDKLLTDELVSRTGKTVDEIKAIMTEERIFTGQEAVDFGIGDNLLDPLKEAANFDVSKFVNKNLDKYTVFLQDLKVEGNYSDNEPGQPDPNTGGNEMDWTEAQNKFKPQIDALIKDGITAGTKIALPKALEDALPAALADAIKKENERIAAIETLSVEGNDDIKKIIDEAKKDLKATKESVAVLIIDAQNKAAKEKKDKIKTDTDNLNVQTENISTDPPTDDEQKNADKEAEELAAEQNKEKGYEVKA